MRKTTQQFGYHILNTEICTAIVNQNKSAQRCSCKSLQQKCRTQHIPVQQNKEKPHIQDQQIQFGDLGVL